MGWALQTLSTCDVASASAIAPVIIAWRGQTEFCALAKAACFEGKDPSVVAAVARCLQFATKEQPQLARDYIQIITRELRENLPVNQQEMLLVLLCACLKHNPSALDVPLIDHESALQLLVRINPVIYKQLVFILIQKCTYSERFILADLIDSWKAKWPDSMAFFNWLHRAATGGFLAPSATGQGYLVQAVRDAALLENTVRVGDPGVTREKAPFVDAWTVVEGAKDSNANCEFLMNAVVRQIQKG